MNIRTPTPAQIRADAARLVTGVLHEGRSLDELLAADPDEGSARKTSCPSNSHTTSRIALRAIWRPLTSKR